MRLALAGVWVKEQSGCTKIWARAKSGLSREPGDVSYPAPLPASSMLLLSSQFSGFVYFLSIYIHFTPD